MQSRWMVGSWISDLFLTGSGLSCNLLVMPCLVTLPLLSPLHTLPPGPSLHLCFILIAILSAFLSSWNSLGQASGEDEHKKFWILRLIYLKSLPFQKARKGDTGARSPGISNKKSKLSFSDSMTQSSLRCTGVGWCLPFTRTPHISVQWPPRKAPGDRAQLSSNYRLSSSFGLFPHPQVAGNTWILEEEGIRIGGYSGLKVTRSSNDTAKTQTGSTKV